MHRVYLDNNATTPLLPEVFEVMRPYFFEKFGNASSIHQQGQQARSAVEHAREQVAELLNCRPAEIVFTSGGTEGDNLALFGLMKPGDHIITSAVEHHAVLNASKRLEEMGCVVTYLPVDGRALVDPDAQCLAENFFGLPLRIDVGGVEEIHARLDADFDEPARLVHLHRSEERRVGKECR